MIFTKSKPKKKCGRKPVPAGREKTCFMALKTTKEIAALVREVQRIKRHSVRIVFENALREYIRNDEELKHLAEKSSCISGESV